MVAFPRKAQVEPRQALHVPLVLVVCRPYAQWEATRLMGRMEPILPEDGGILQVVSACPRTQGLPQGLAANPDCDLGQRARYHHVLSPGAAGLVR